jgi:hypothetical protein
MMHILLRLRDQYVPDLPVGRCITFESHVKIANCALFTLVIAAFMV